MSKVEVKDNRSTCAEKPFMCLVAGQGFSYSGSEYIKICSPVGVDKALSLDDFALYSVAQSMPVIPINMELTIKD